MTLRYIDLCNKTLRRLNEVEITPPDFNTVRGIQALVKDAVNESIAQINQTQFEWPFNAAEETSMLTVGQTEYAFSSSFQSIEWGSFQILPSDYTDNRSVRLTYIDRDEWYDKYRDQDDSAGTAGLGTPTFVFRAHGSGFGISPSPDKPYRIQFRYYLNYVPLVSAADATTIPDDFDRVIVDGAVARMCLFKDNTEGAAAAFDSFQQGIKSLRSLYINTYDSIRDTRVNFGGGRGYRVLM